MSAQRLRVVKVGGSLLDSHNLPAELQRFLAKSDNAINVLIVGGGTLVDEIRRLQPILGFTDQEAHWRCIDLLSTTAKLLSHTLPSVPLTADWIKLRDSAASIFDPAPFLKATEQGKRIAQLPEGWAVTTDSIAACLAQHISADELLILKSAAPSSDDIDDLAKRGYVDSHFPVAAKSVDAIRFVNARMPNWAQAED